MLDLRLALRGASVEFSLPAGSLPGLLERSSQGSQDQSSGVLDKLLSQDFLPFGQASSQPPGGSDFHRAGQWLPNSLPH